MLSSTLFQFPLLVAIYSTVFTGVLSVASNMTNSTENGDGIVDTTETAPLDALDGANDDLISNPTPKARQHCSAMRDQDWDDYKYACSWYHNELGYNFFMRWDGSTRWECWCDGELSTYDPWGSRWNATSAARTSKSRATRAWATRSRRSWSSTALQLATRTRRASSTPTTTAIHLPV